MPKIPNCVRLCRTVGNRCFNNAHTAYLVCAIHPDGLESEVCPDFADDGQELWCPDGYTFIDDELVKLPTEIHGT